ncbi:peptidylprolyl isomerase [Campylobacter sp. MIT 99-7217]|uniref:peptidylprolyl isomerase n=1 Tax=Campylobacter sp. MIT 99-7217 TaxID=535091 RepID=UPI00115A2F8A|nr:peptidylprolyl isomerase [Campylobacter sp. MIT 99-7217]TQR34668.1 peptidylprolyl isomerase [Campylobacter sp. MIT 99-7217]
MKKMSLVLAGLLSAVSLNAAVVATMNGKNVTDTEISEAFAPVLRGQNFKDLTADQKQELILRYMGAKLIAEDAKKQNLEKDPLYAKALENAKEQILMQIYQEKIFNSIKVDESKIKAFYEQNKAKFIRPAGVKARHILVKTEKEARDVIAELKGLKGNALTEKFAQLAAAKSIDGSARQGGDLGWFGTEDMVKPFSDAAFSLKNGTITQNPIKTEFGYHVILKEDSQAKKQLSYNDVKADLINQAKAQEAGAKLNEKVQELLKNAKVEIK